MSSTQDLYELWAEVVQGSGGELQPHWHELPAAHQLAFEYIDNTNTDEVIALTNEIKAAKREIFDTEERAEEAESREQEAIEQRKDLEERLEECQALVEEWRRKAEDETNQTIIIIETSRGLESTVKLPEATAKGFVDGFNLAVEMWNLDGGACIWPFENSTYSQEEIDELISTDQEMRIMANLEIHIDELEKLPILSCVVEAQAGKDKRFVVIRESDKYGPVMYKFMEDHTKYYNGGMVEVTQVDSRDVLVKRWVPISETSGEENQQ